MVIVRVGLGLGLGLGLGVGVGLGLGLGLGLGPNLLVHVLHDHARGREFLGLLPVVGKSRDSLPLLRRSV